MKTHIKRDLYLQKLVNRRYNGEVKIITGCHRCGKSWLLKKIYRNYLLDYGVKDEDIIIVSFDTDEDVDGRDYADPITLKRYLYGRMTKEQTQYYVFLDKVQQVVGFERIVNGLNAQDNVEVYITGSNSEFLSSDIRTIFCGREMK